LILRNEQTSVLQDEVSVDFPSSYHR